MIAGHRKTTDEEGLHYCKEYIPDIAGTYSGALIIIGGGRDMWADYERAKSLFPEADTMAVNVAGMFINPLTHLYSLHFKHISYISKWRKMEYCGDGHICHSNKMFDGIDHEWKCSGRTSTSGSTAVTLGWLLGYRKMVLAGVPMDGTGYFYKPSINETFNDDQREKEIYALKETFGDMVCSMSGKTRDILGGADGCK